MSLSGTQPTSAERRGQRIQIIGSTNAGKSTLAASLSQKHNLPFIDLDALNWQAGWHGLNEHDPTAFEEKITSATTGDSWVVAGNYHTFSQKLIWPQADTIIWLDRSLSLCSARLLQRSWHRWRTQEILWGTNSEKFWPQLAIWKENSLLRWLWKTHQPNRQRALTAMTDPRWAHLNFVHLRTQREIDALSFDRWTAR